MAEETTAESAPQATKNKPKMTPESSPEQSRAGFLARKWEAVRATTDATAKAATYATLHTPHALFDASRYLTKTHLLKDPAWEAVKTDPIPLPHAQGAVELFARRYGKDFPENAQVVKELFEDFFKEEMQNSRIYQTHDGQASFPYTSINVADIARRLHQEWAPEETYLVSTEKPKTEAFYTFGSFLSPKGDAQFTFPEYAMHEYMIKLRKALKDLDVGKTPDNTLLYTIGAPTSLFGTLTEQAVQTIESQDDPYRGLYGDWYSQFIKDQPQADHTHFWGESMGSFFAVATAERLLQKGIVTQRGVEKKSESNPDGKPYLTIIVDAPEMHPTWSGAKRLLKTNIGFGLSGIAALAARPDLRKSFSQNKFLAQIASQLEQNGYQVHLSEEELALKNRTNKKMTDVIREGWTFDPTATNVDLRAGVRDLTIESREIGNLDRAKNKRLKEKGLKNPITRDIVRQEGKTRTYAVDVHHIFPKFRPSELRRWKITSDKVINLKKFGSTKAPEPETA